MLPALVLVPELERSKDAEPAGFGRGHGVDGELPDGLHASERQPTLAVAGDTDNATIADRDRAHAASRVPVEPPVERLAAHRTSAPGVAEQAQVVIAVRGLVRLEAELLAHLEAVPSAELKARRTRVPVTVSLTAIRSHAPASTSSKVRAGYGSTL